MDDFSLIFYLKEVLQFFLCFTYHDFAHFNIYQIVNQQLKYFNCFTNYRLESGDVKVHFNVHFDPAKGEVSSDAITESIQNEMIASNSTGSVLHPLDFDLDSINIQERSALPPPNLRESPGLVFGESTVKYSTSSEHPDIDRRQCHPFHIKYCNQLPYNFTTFPNAMGHQNYEEAKYDLERFK